MKIVAGLGNIEDYPDYVAAGTDEVFCGYVPHGWNEKYGMLGPANRREVRYYQVQVGALEELKILANMVKHYQVPVTITLNSLYYRKEQYAEVYEIIEMCMSIGFTSFIIADMALLVYLKKKRCQATIHVSGEMAEVNEKFLEELEGFQPKRVIFHRKMTIDEMKSCIDEKQKGINEMKSCINEKQKSIDEMKSCHVKSISEYEAFLLNELCQFTGAYCNSLHCDELCHICHLPYELGTILQGNIPIAEEKEFPNVEPDLCGATGCGLCALWDLQKAGVTHLKIVGRGNFAQEMCRDISYVRQALDILVNAKTKEQYLLEMNKTLFPDGCSGRCYYPQGIIL